MAKKFPDKFFVGVERNVTCAGFTAKKLVEADLPNARLMFINAEILMPKIKDNSIDGIILNFSDPWPKKRHHKRRLTSDRFTSLYKKVLKDDGVIIQKTDNLELFDFSIETFKEAGFKIK
jgi:tRNA (guanine-N7-)-methyltransferase